MQPFSNVSSMTRKQIIIISIVLLGLVSIYKIASLITPGSYPFAENYILNYPEKDVIEAIERIKSADNDLKVPTVTIQNSGQHELNDGKKNESDYWYKFYFYNKKKDQIIFTWTRPIDNNKTTFAFVSINEGLNIGNWKNINEDFDFLENRKLKNEFENTILKKIEKTLNEK